MSKKHKKVCTTLSYIEHFLILTSTITGCILISAFASLIGFLIRTYEICNEIKNLCNNCRNKKYKSIIKKKKKVHDKIVLLAKSKLNSVEILISKVLIDSVISHDEFVLINNVKNEYNETKEEIKNLKT